MADANLTLKISADSSGAKAGTKDVISGINAVGVAADATTKKIRATSVSARQIYEDEIRVTSLRASGLNGVADALQRQIGQRREALKIAKETQITEQQALVLVRQRAAQEERLAAAQVRQAPAINRVQLSGQGQAGRPRSLDSYNSQINGKYRLQTKGTDATQAYYAAQDLAQGGVGAVANQGPIILDLLARYGKGAVAALGPLAPALAAVGVAAASAYTGFKLGERLVGDGQNENKKLSLRDIQVEQNAIKAAHRARQKSMEDAKLSGAASASTFGNVYDVSGRLDSAGQDASVKLERQRLQNALEKERLNGIQDETKRRKALRELEKRVMQEESNQAVKLADSNFQIAAAASKNAAAELRIAEARREFLRKNEGYGTAEELAKLDAALPGMRSSTNAARNRAEQANKTRAGALENQNNLPKQMEILDQQAANEASRDATKKMQSVWNGMIGAINSGFRAAGKAIDDAQKALDAKTRRGMSDEDLKIAELRASGRGRQADRLERKAAVGRRADDLVKNEGRTPEDARQFAEREYASQHSTGRIRGAGYNRSRQFSNGGGGGSTSGLDGLAELQTKNHRIRGAGAKDDKAKAGDDGGNQLQIAPGSGVAGVIIGLLGTIASKLDVNSPRRQPVRR